MPTVTPPVPDPNEKPLRADDLAADGEREGPVLVDEHHTDEIESERADTPAAADEKER